MNLEKYGQPKPPSYNLSNISGFDMLMVTGETDTIAPPEDTSWLHETLIDYGNTVDFKMYPHGHLGLLMPADTTSVT